MSQSKDIFDPNFVKGVFDRCGPNYRIWSQVASFGFVWIWRRQCISNIPPISEPKPVVYDLMAGTGETWPILLRRFPKLSGIHAIDISTSMVRYAIERLHAIRSERIEIREANILADRLPESAADVVVCTFGLKTFNAEQQRLIAMQLARCLKPGGAFSFVEASDPHGWVFRRLYRFYMTRVLPLVEKYALRGAQDFAMIGAYTANFRDCGHFESCCRAAGLEVSFRKLFFGCATAVTGKKPLQKA
jgi:ubiquinone/menaquinone biosynthesis C-methylase UbiE